MGVISAAITTFKEAAGPHWLRMAIVIGGGAYSAISFVEGWVERHGYEAIFPTWPKIAYTLGALALLLVFWLLSYATRLRLEKEPKLKLIKISETQQRDDVATIQTFGLSVQNSGLKALSNCLVKLDALAGAANSRNFSPTALTTSAQGQQQRAGGFNLRSQEKKDVPLCTARISPGELLPVLKTPS